MAIKFKLMDVPIVIGLDFLFIMLILGSLWRAPEQLPIWMVIVTGSVLVHELGHAVMFDIFGLKPTVRLYGGGGVTMAMTDPRHPLTPGQSVVIAAAGPATGLILGGIMGLAVLAAPRIGSSAVVQDFLWVSLGWSLINLLPLPGVDGGSIVTDLTQMVLGRPAEAIGRVVGFVIVAAALVALIGIRQYSAAFVIGFFVVINMARIGFGSGLRVGKRVLPMGGAPNSPAELMVEGRYQEAFNAARLQMADRPGDLGPIVAASDALRLMSRYADAEIGYNRVLAVDPARDRALRGRALTRRSLGRDADAAADLQTLLSMPLAGAIVSQSSALYGFERHDQGRRLIQAALPGIHDPMVARILTSFLPMFEYGLGQPDRALAHLDEVLGFLPDDAGLHELRALILIDLGRSPEAIGEVRGSLASKPHHPSYLETLGIAVRMSGDAMGAHQPLALSTEVRPSDPRARSELVLCLAQIGRAGEARAALETLPGYAVREAWVAYARAALAVAGGTPDEAVALLTEARRIRPELGVRAGVDPLFRELLADPARRAAVVAATD